MKYLLIFLFLLPFCVLAQGVIIKGIVTERGSNQPVPAASVFINNSTYGSICDDKGLFSIRQYPAFPFELVVTAIGYESKTITITEADHLVSIDLIPKVFDLGEVNVISPEKDGWQKFGKTFMEEFIGYSAYAADCKLLNKNALHFYWDQENMVLKVTAGAPLKIENNAMGYYITYWLEDFELNYITRKLYFRGYSQFEEMQSKKTHKVEKWKANRLSAYRGSLYHFMRSLYRGVTLSEGFEIRTLKRVGEKEAGKYRPVSTDTVSLTDNGEMKDLLTAMYGDNPDTSLLLHTIIKVKSWYSDTAMLQPLRLKGNPGQDSGLTREFRFVKFANNRQQVIVRYFESRNAAIASAADAAVLNDRDNPPGIKIAGDSQASDKPVVKLMRRNGIVNEPGELIISPELVKQLPPMQERILDILFTDIVPLDSIIKRDSAGAVRLEFKDYLHITYLYEAEEKEYFHRFFPALNMLSEKQESIISIAAGKTLLIMPDGNFRDTYDLLAEKYWAYEKLDKLLPVNFEP